MLGQVVGTDTSSGAAISALLPRGFGRSGLIYLGREGKTWTLLQAERGVHLGFSTCPKVTAACRAHSWMHHTHRWLLSKTKQWYPTSSKHYPSKSTVAMATLLISKDANLGLQLRASSWLLHTSEDASPEQCFSQSCQGSSSACTQVWPWYTGSTTVQVTAPLRKCFGQGGVSLSRTLLRTPVLVSGVREIRPSCCG